MNKRTFILLSLSLILGLISCEKNDYIDDNKEIKLGETISLDSIYFSCKINDKLIELSSPSLTSGTINKMYKRLYKLPGHAKDSAIIQYSNQYQDEDYLITFGISGAFLVDTTSILGPGVKDLLYAEGEYLMQYLPTSGKYLEKETNKYLGYFIEIIDRKNYNHYFSYLAYSPPVNEEEYTNFKVGSSLKINRSEIVQIPYNNYLIPQHFIEFSFNCKLFQFSSIHDYSTLTLTDGVIRGCLD